MNLLLCIFAYIKLIFVPQGLADTFLSLQCVCTVMIGRVRYPTAATICTPRRRWRKGSLLYVWHCHVWFTELALRVVILVHDLFCRPWPPVLAFSVVIVTHPGHVVQLCLPAPFKAGRSTMYCKSCSCYVHWLYNECYNILIVLLH